MIGLEYVLFINNVNRTHLAEQLGVSSQLINHWVSGRRIPSEENLIFLENTYGIPRSYLLNEVTGKERIEIELLLGAEHSNSDLQTIIKERDNIAKNFNKLLDKYNALKTDATAKHGQLIQFIDKLYKES